MLLYKEIYFYFILILFNLIICFSKKDDEVGQYIGYKKYVHMMKRFKEEEIIRTKLEQEIEQFAKILPSIVVYEVYDNHTGRIGFIGGAIESNRGLYIAAMASLQAGGELCYVIFAVASDNPAPLPSYFLFLPFPHEKGELEMAISKLGQMNSLVIGPDLGKVFWLDDFEHLKTQVLKILEGIRTNSSYSIPLILDDEGVKVFLSSKDVLRNYPGTVYVNQNSLEIKNLANDFLNKTNFNGEDENDLQELIGTINPNAILVLQHHKKVDKIVTANKTYTCSYPRPSAKCKNQGALVTGLLGLYSHYAEIYKEREHKINFPPEIGACYAALSISHLCCKYKQMTEKFSLVDVDYFAVFQNATIDFFNKNYTVL